jgi:hypothetical protein
MQAADAIHFLCHLYRGMVPCQPADSALQSVASPVGIAIEVWPAHDIAFNGLHAFGRAHELQRPTGGNIRFTS